MPEHDHRTRRYLRRAGLWPLTGLERLAKCGRCRTSGYVALRFVGGVSGFAGLATCGSVWVCPVCAAKIAARRQLEIQAAICAWYVAGGRVAFSTFTMRHQAGDGLQTLWDALQGAWGALTSGAPWGRAKDRSGLAGWLRLVEVTLGPNGWHVHIHALLFLPGATTVDDLATLHGWMVGRWQAALERRGFSAVAYAQDSHLVDGGALERIAEYFAKSTDTGRVLPGERGGPARGESAHPADASRSVALEFSRSHSKAARSALGTLPPFSLLDRVFLEGDAEALDLWLEWEQGSHGRRQLTWSKGIRDLLGLTAERSDDDIAAEELGTSDDELLLIPAEGWAQLLARPALIPQLLTATDAGGLAGARTFLDRHQVEYLLPGAAA